MSQLKSSHFEGTWSSKHVSNLRFSSGIRIYFLLYSWLTFCEHRPIFGSKTQCLKTIKKSHFSSTECLKKFWIKKSKKYFVELKGVLHCWNANKLSRFFRGFWLFGIKLDFWTKNRQNEGSFGIALLEQTFTIFFSDFVHDLNVDF